MNESDKDSLSFYNDKYQKGTEKLHSYKVKLLEFLPEEKSKVLDIGCGSGIMAEKISALGHDVEGIDVSDEAVKKLKEKGISGKKVDVNKSLPFESATFDVVWCSDLIEHIISPGFLLGETHRVLKKDGILLLTTTNSAYFIFRILHLLGKTCSDIQHLHHIHFFSSKGLKKVLRDKNFKVLEVVGRNTPIIFPKKVLKPLFFIPLLTEEKVLKLFALFGLKEEDTLTRGPVILSSFFSKKIINFFADEFLIKASKT